MSKLSLLLAALIPCYGVASGAAAEEIPPCTPPAGVSVMREIWHLPTAVAYAMGPDIGGSAVIANPGTPFDATDIVRTGIRYRVITVWHAADRWIVAFEHGGRSYNDPIFVYRWRSIHEPATRVAKAVAFPSTVCKTLRALAAHT